MLKEMKKKVFRRAIVVILIMMIAGVALIATMLEEAIPTFASKKDIYEASIKEIQKTKNAKIEIDKYNLYGCFMEEYQTSSDNPVKETTAYYCIVLVGDEDDARFMAVKVDAKYKDKLDKIEEEYTDLDNGIESDDRTVITVKGKLRKMDSEEYGYFTKFMKEYAETEEEIPFISLNLCLEKSGVNLQVIGAISGVILIIIAIIMLIYVLVTGGTGKVSKQFEKLGQVEFERAENDYFNAVNIGKNIKIGKDYTFVTRTLRVDVIPHNDIVWAYKIKTRHRANGIPTGTSYSVCVYEYDRKDHVIKTDDEAMAEEILQLYSQISDRMVIGYDNEYRKMFNRDYDRFLSIAYNRVNENQYDEMQNDEQDETL